MGGGEIRGGDPRVCMNPCYRSMVPNYSSGLPMWSYCVWCQIIEDYVWCQCGHMYGANGVIINVVICIMYGVNVVICIMYGVNVVICIMYGVNVVILYSRGLCMVPMWSYSRESFPLPSKGCWILWT